MQSAFFSIRRATGAVQPIAGALAARQFALRVTAEGSVLAYSPQDGRLDVLTLSGSRVASLALAAGSETRWHAPHPGTYLVAVMSRDGSVLRTQRVSLVAGSR
jgi:hypothetical protein